MKSHSVWYFMDIVDKSGKQAVKNVSSYFKLDATVVDQYVDKARHILNAKSQFLNPDPSVRRYILIAVDPAGGGTLSDEAVAVFIIANNEFGLFTGCLLEPHHKDFPFSVVPTVFLLGLLAMVRAVKAALKKLHLAAGLASDTFQMPPVLVLLENNFAYGAAVYIHLLYFLEEKRSQHPELKDVDLSFATPVYGLDEPLVQLFLDRQRAAVQLKALQLELKGVIESIDSIWKGHRRIVGWNQLEIKKRIQERLRDRGITEIDMPNDLPLDAVAEEVTDVLGDIIVAMQSNPNISETLVKEVQANRAGEMREPFALMYFLQNEITVTKSKISIIEKQIRDRRAGHDGGGRNDQGHLQFRIRPWPEEHRVTYEGQDPTIGKVVYPPGMYYNAKRTAFGTQTTETEKAMTFNYFVGLVKSSLHPMSLLVPPDEPPSARVDCKMLRQSPKGPFHAIQYGETVFRCIVHQWSQLYVMVDKKGVAVHVTGKQPGQRGDGVHKDDMWMAFSIGIQWCTEFTRLIPNAYFREQMVGYMRSLKRDSFDAMRLSLQAAELGGDDTTIPRDGPSIAPVQPETAIPRTIAIAPRALAASVAVCALVNAAINCTWDLRCLLRSLIVALDIQGHRPPKMYALTGGRIERGVRAPNNIVREQVLRSLRREDRTAIPLDTLQKTFGRSSHIVRFVCTASARHAWPGDARNGNTRRRGGTPQSIRDQLEWIRERIQRLMVIEPSIMSVYAVDHAVLASVNTQPLLNMFLARLFRMTKDTETLISTAMAIDRDAIHLCNTKWMGELNQLWVDKSLVASTEAPWGFFALYTQCAEELQFLRSLATFDRNRIVGSFLQSDQRRLECPLPGGYPAIGVRLTVRAYTDWVQAFRTLFPTQYAKWKATSKSVGRTTTVYQTRLVVRSPYYNGFKSLDSKPTTE